jgi:hypothetical protein
MPTHHILVVQVLTYNHPAHRDLVATAGAVPRLVQLLTTVTPSTALCEKLAWALSNLAQGSAPTQARAGWSPLSRRRLHAHSRCLSSGHVACMHRRVIHPHSRIVASLAAGGVGAAGGGGGAGGCT